MKGKELIWGLSAGDPGTTIGYAKVTNAGKGDNIGPYDPGDILVCSSWGYGGDNLDYLKKAAALVQNEGSWFNGTIVCRELGKPCIIQTVRISGTKATEVLKQGLMVIVEGYTGEIDVVDENGEPFRKIRYGTVYQYLPDIPGEPGVGIPVRTQPKPLVVPRPSRPSITKPFNLAEFLKKYEQRLKDKD